MKTGIHPKYHQDVKVQCACGNSFVTGSTFSEIKVDICSACHPFFTGETKYIDTAGRIDKFMDRENKKSSTTKSTSLPKSEVVSEETTQSLKEMLQSAKKNIQKNTSH